MKTLQRIILITCLFTSFSLYPLQKSILTKAAWLLGTWEMQTSRGSIYEGWSQTNASTFSGKSYAIQGQDTMIFETIQLVASNEKLNYIPVVKNQNGGNPVSFEASIITDSKLVFENSDHDFPQKISYQLVAKDSLVAEISGTINGQFQNQFFKMKRKN